MSDLLMINATLTPGLNHVEVFVGQLEQFVYGSFEVPALQGTDADDYRLVMFTHLVVCHCYRESDSIIRIINARKATRQEAHNYVEFCKMKKEYDFIESKPNPYIRKLKGQVSIGIDEDALEYL
jgi:hypothetical protein